MDTNTDNPSNTGRKRQQKRNKRDKLLAVHCSSTEAIIIRGKAKEMNLTVSELLRELGMNGEVSFRDRPLTSEILAFHGSLYQILANQEQIIQKLLSEGQLTKQECAALALQTEQWTELPQLIKNKLQ